MFELYRLGLSPGINSSLAFNKVRLTRFRLHGGMNKSWAKHKLLAPKWLRIQWWMGSWISTPRFVSRGLRQGLKPKTTETEKYDSGSIGGGWSLNPIYPHISILQNISIHMHPYPSISIHIHPYASIFIVNHHLLNLTSAAFCPAPRSFVFVTCSFWVDPPDFIVFYDGVL